MDIEGYFLVLGEIFTLVFILVDRICLLLCLMTLTRQTSVFINDNLVLEQFF